jgi:perosamine synthetase
MERIYVSEPTLGALEIDSVVGCVNRGWLTQGPLVSTFEAMFSTYCQCAHGIATTSGTTALHLLLKSLGIKPGDEVIVPNLTFVATANAVSYCGAKVVLVDVEDSTWNIDPQRVLAAITPRTRAIIAVHLYGLPANMFLLRDIVNRSKQQIFLIEDAAEAIGGAIYPRKPVGSLASDAAVFSFYANKTITTGEGGMVVTNNQELAERLRFLRGQAQDPQLRYYHSEVGFNYRMTDLQAAIGCGQMAKIDALVARRQDIWIRYAMHFGQHQRQHSASNVTHAGWMFVALFDDNKQRDLAAKKLEENNIETRPVFVPLSMLPMYEEVWKTRSELTTSLFIRNRGLCLPTHANLDDSDIDRVIKVVKEVMP